MCSADFLLWSASLRISAATTAKPLPCSPARAASTAAFSASMLVSPASSPTTLANDPPSARPAPTGAGSARPPSLLSASCPSCFGNPAGEPDAVLGHVERLLCLPPPWIRPAWPTGCDEAPSSSTVLVVSSHRHRLLRHRALVLVDGRCDLGGGGSCRRSLRPIDRLMRDAIHAPRTSASITGECGGADSDGNQLRHGAGLCLASRGSTISFRAFPSALRQCVELADQLDGFSRRGKVPRLRSFCRHPSSQDNSCSSVSIRLLEFGEPPQVLPLLRVLHFSFQALQALLCFRYGRP